MLTMIVFVKQVPGSDDLRLDPKTGKLNREGVDSIMNPYDACAVEEALRLKAAHGGIIHVVTMGPPQAAAVLKEAIAMGCDRGYLLSDRAFGGADSIATGRTLAAAARKIGNYDLLLFGRCASDAETAQTGPVTAELLDLPHATLVSCVEAKDGSLTVNRDLDNMEETVRLQMPAALCLTGDLNEPRQPDLVKLLLSDKAPIETWDAAALEVPAETVGKPGSPSITLRVFEPAPRDMNTEYFTGSPDEIAARFADVLEQEHFI